MAHQKDGTKTEMSCMVSLTLLLVWNPLFLSGFLLWVEIKILTPNNDKIKRTITLKNNLTIICTQLEIIRLNFDDYD